MQFFASLTLSTLFLVGLADAQQPTRIYIAPDDHTDLWWSGTEQQYETAFLNTIDYYLDQIDQTASAPSDFQARWNCDGSLWMWVYEHNRTAQEFDRLVDRIRDGHVSVPLNPLCVCVGGAPAEAVLRGMYYPARVGRRVGLSFPLAYTMENQTQPLGLYSLWAGSGARWSWKGICDCATRVTAAWDREHDIYWGTGLDGQRVLMKWNSLLGNNWSMGGYAEARHPGPVVDYVSSDPAFQARYPYSVIGCFGQGWDDFQTMTTQFPSIAQQKTNATRQVRVSNEEDFFVDFEATHGASIPSQSVSYGNEWELDSASLQEVTSRIKRAVEKVRAAEAMAVTAARLVPSLLDSRTAQRDRAWMNLGLFFEHDFGMGGFSPTDPWVTGRIAWQRRLADEVDAYVDSLYDDSRQALGDLIPSGSVPRFFVFNPLGCARDDVADFAWTGTGPVHVIDVTAAAEVPSQVVQIDGRQYVRILASKVPAVGYRVYELHSGAGTTFAPAATVTMGASNATIDNGRYGAVVEQNGAISSLIDHQLGGREFVRRLGGQYMNDLGASTGTLTIENSGPVSVSLRATAPGPLPHTTVVTLFRGGDRVEIENRITANFSATTVWSFGFDLDNPTVHHEEVGAILRADLAPRGDYATRNARYDWLTLNHFCDISADGGAGVTLSNWDCGFFRLGNSSTSLLDTATPRIRVLAGGQRLGTTGLPSQGGDSLFLQRFALRTHDQYDATAAMEAALAHQNPLVAGAITGSDPRLPVSPYGMVTIDDSDALLWAFKPHDAGLGEGIVARIWNVSRKPVRTNFRLQHDTIRGAYETTHLETDRSAIPLVHGNVPLSLAPQQMTTVRLIQTLAADAIPYGTGCPGPQGVPTLTARGGALPWLGRSFTMDLAPIGPAELPLVLFGFSNQTWSGLQLPLSLAGFGMPGCSLLASPDSLLPINHLGTSAEAVLQLPPSYEMMGSIAYVQGMVLTPGAQSAGYTTAAIELHLGYQ